MFLTLQFLRSTGRRLRSTLSRIAAKLRPTGPTKVSLEISIPLFLKITLETTFREK